MARELIVSPKGKALWAKVFDATSFEDEGEKSWSVSLLLDPQDPEAVAFLEKIDEIFKGYHGTKCRVAKYGMPYRMEKTVIDGQEVETGNVEVRFKRNERARKTGTVYEAPVIVDAKKNPWPKDKLIGNGSSIRVAFGHYDWDISGKGITLRLEMVQVLDLVEYTAGSDPFQEEEGYTLPPQVETPFASEPEPLSMAEKIKARAAQVRAEAPAALAQANAEEVPF